MEGFRILIYSVLFIISLVNIISYYSKKSKDKKISKSIVKDLTPHRVIDEKEALALKKLYKVDIEAGSPVYYITGNYEKHILTVNNGATDETHTIGNVLVWPHNGIKDQLENATEIEVTDLQNKKGAIIVSLNGDQNVTDEVKIQEALDNGQSFYKKTQDGLDFSINKGRELLEEENYYLTSDFRIIINLIILSLLSIPIFLPNSIYKTYINLSSILLAALIFYKLYKPSFINKKVKIKNLTEISGSLLIENGFHYINRFTLNFPKKWNNNLEPGQLIEIGGVVSKTDKNLIKVLTVNRRSILPLNEKIERFILTIILGIIFLILLLAPLGNIKFKIKTAIEYNQTKDLPVEFNDYENIKNYNFKPGQYVEFKNQNKVPNIEYVYGNNYIENNSQGLYITNSSKNYKMDLSSIYDEISHLNKLQMTKGFLNLYVYLIDDYTAYDYYIDNYYVDIETAESMDEYDKYFEENKYYYILKESTQVVSNFKYTDTTESAIRYPEGGHLKEYLSDKFNYTDKISFLLDNIGFIYKYFLEEQSNLLKDHIQEIQKEYISNREHILIKTNSEEPIDLYFTPNSITKLSLGNYPYSNKLNMFEELELVNILKEYVNEINNSLEMISEITGVVEDYNMTDKLEIVLDTSRDYSNIIANYIDIISFVSFLIFITYAILQIYLIVQRSKHS